MATLTAKRLRQHLQYVPETGEFWWLIRRHKRRLDRQAGTIVTVGKSPQTVRAITIDGQRYYAHVLAWVWMTGHWPKTTIDHWDQDTLNNRWSNLRQATRSEQNMNRRPARPGLTGASFHKPSGLWQAYIKQGGKRTQLGYFKTAEEAHEAYRQAAIDRFGQFAHTTLARTGRRR